MPHFVKHTVKRLIDDHRAPMLLLDPHRSRIIYANRRAKELFGNEFFNAFCDREHIRRHIERSLESPFHHFKIDSCPEKKRTLRIDISRIDIGRRCRLLLVISDLSRSTRAKEGIRRINDDLTRQVEEERTLRQYEQNHLLQQSRMAAMGEMIDVIAHQWKQPLNSISLYASMLRDDYRDELIDHGYIEEVSRKMESQIEHLSRTINEFRNFLHEDKRKEAFTLEQVLGSVLTLLEGDLLQNRITLQKEADLPILLQGYPNEFKHILINLIVNAKEAFLSNPDVKRRRISIYTLDEEKNRLLCVSDNAGGIPEELLEKIFEPRFTTKGAQGGTGMGLYLCKKIARKHGVALTASLTKNGTLFTLKFPKN